MMVPIFKMLNRKKQDKMALYVRVSVCVNPILISLSDLRFKHNTPVQACFAKHIGTSASTVSSNAPSEQ